MGLCDYRYQYKRDYYLAIQDSYPMNNFFFVFGSIAKVVMKNNDDGNRPCKYLNKVKFLWYKVDDSDTPVVYRRRRKLHKNQITSSVYTALHHYNRRCTMFRHILCEPCVCCRSLDDPTPTSI